MKDDGLKTMKWIPVKEKLPEYDDTISGYLVSIGNWVGILSYIEKEGGFVTYYGGEFHLPDCPVEAWMPLPKSYKEETTE